MGCSGGGMSATRRMARKNPAKKMDIIILYIMPCRQCRIKKRGFMVLLRNKQKHVSILRKIEGMMSY